MKSTQSSTSKTPQKRTSRKEATRHRLLMAALRLVDEGRTPSELGLREVARAADMAAPSIYNHFANMDELRFALVDECLTRLRSTARLAGSQMTSEGLEDALHALLKQFLRGINEFESYLRLLIIQWFNPNPEYRRIIYRELSIMRQDLAANMQVAATEKGMDKSEFSVESDAIFSLLITFILSAIDMEESKREERLAIIEKQVLMIVFGGRMLSATRSDSTTNPT